MSDTQHDPIEALLDDFIARLRNGETPSIAEYEATHPEFAEEVRQAFPAVQVIEQAALRREQQRPSVKGERPPERLGDFKIIREIGRGGMGVVYEAEQVSLSRRVAVKVLPRHVLLEPKQVQRFDREARTAARLHHTNIVPVFGVGADEGYHYFVMQLIDGSGLDRVFADLPDDTSELPDLPGFAKTNKTDYWQAVAEIGVQVADAVAYAHAQGTLHRDVKPANLLLDEQGVVWVTDFGLAKAIQQDTASQTDGIAGTLRYMAPEQLNGHADTRSDIYGLGLTLYELLALRPAYDATSTSSLIQKLSQTEATRLRKINPRIPRDLETIVAKAAAHNPADRYASAAELAGDLRCFLDDRPIRARRVTTVEHAWRWSRRNPMLAALSAASVLLLISVTALSTFGYVQLRGAYNQVDEALGEARGSEERAVAAAEHAEDERDHARSEYERAESNLAVAMSALDEISDRLASRQLPQSVQLAEDDLASLQLVGGLSTEDAEIVQSLLKFYNQFAANNEATAVVDRATAKVHQRMGDIRARLGQYEQAATAYQRALVIAGDVHNPGSPENDLVLFRVKILNSLGQARRKIGDFRGAIEAHRQAQKQLENVTPELASQQVFRYRHALTLNDLVLTRSAEFMHQQTRRGPSRPGQEPRTVASPEIDDEFQQALNLLEGLVHEQPQNADYCLALARCHRGILSVAWANREDDVAANAKQRAIAILRQLADAASGNPAFHLELADTLAMTAYTDSRTPLSGTDVTSLAESIEITTRLCEQFPTAPEPAVLAASTHQKLGAHFIATRRWGDSEEHLTKAIKLLQRLAQSSSANPLFQVSLARVRWELADVLRRQGSLQRARELLEMAISDYASFRDSEAGRKTSPGLLVGLYRQLARTLEQLGEKKLADEASRTADRLRPASQRHAPTRPPLHETPVLSARSEKRKDVSE